jgi:hypothetical protein
MRLALRGSCPSSTVTERIAPAILALAIFRIP